MLSGLIFGETDTDIWSFVVKNRKGRLDFFFFFEDHSCHQQKKPISKLFTALLSGLQAANLKVHLFDRNHHHLEPLL